MSHFFCVCFTEKLNNPFVMEDHNPSLPSAEEIEVVTMDSF